MRFSPEAEGRAASSPQPEAAMQEKRARVLAFYLPQFHPIPENDEWWGPGFTEWTNVAKARPLYRNHWQPRLPADLGFYDLRLPESREHQAVLAREAGVEGFCYWHYWFGGGRRILERPFTEVLTTGKPDFPFCLAWANQSWIGIWHGNPGSVLMKQEYPGPRDEIAHFNLCLPAFRDRRYVCVDGKPVFVLFAPHDMEPPSAFIEHWRELAHRAGLPDLYFVAISNRYKAGIDKYRNPLLDAFDAITQLSPQDHLETLPTRGLPYLWQKFKERNFGAAFSKLTNNRFRLPLRFEYRAVVEAALNDMPDTPRFLPCVMPGWDNTPRSGSRGVVYENANPELFEQFLVKAITKVKDRPPQQRIIFLKAWNEWAEGNYVEPDTRYGHAYLDAIRAQILTRSPTLGIRADSEG
jgi:hypothetical protein